MKADYSCKYAYIKNKLNEISTVEISLVVNNEKLEVIIKSIDDYYVVDELGDILQGFQKNYLSRMRIDLFDECVVYLDNLDALRKISFVGKTFEINKIEEVERS